MSHDAFDDHVSAVTPTAPEEAFVAGPEAKPATVTPLAEFAELQERFDRLCEELRHKFNVSVIERAERAESAKELHEALHPSACRGGAPGKKGGGKRKGAAVPGFARAIAQRTGLSRRTIELDVQIANGLSERTRERLRNTPIATQTRTLLAIAKLTAEKQDAVTDGFADGNGAERRLLEAVRKLSPTTKRTERPAKRDSGVTPSTPPAGGIRTRCEHKLQVTLGQWRTVPDDPTMEFCVTRVDVSAELGCVAPIVVFRPRGGDAIERLDGNAWEVLP